MSGVFGYPNDPTATTGTVGTGGGNGGTNIGENQTSVAALNNADRGIVGDIGMYRNDTGGKLTTSGSANAYTVALESAPTTLTLADGISFKAIINATNTGATTINVSTQGAKKVLYKGAALSGGELVVGQVYGFSYDASADGGAGAWLLENPSPVAASLPSYDTDDITNASTVDGGAGTLSDVLEGIESDVQAIVTGASASYDTLAEVETAVGAIDARITTAEGELDVVLPDGASGTFTLPRMTTTARDALDMTGKDAGYEIYNTTTGKAEAWDGTSAWIAAGSSLYESGDLEVFLGAQAPTGWTSRGFTSTSGIAGLFKLPFAGSGYSYTHAMMFSDDIHMMVHSLRDSEGEGIFILNVNTGAVTVAPTPTTDRQYWANLVPLPGNKMLLAGGTDGLGYAVSACEIYDLASNTFTDTVALPAPRMVLGTCVLANGDVIAAGGANSPSSSAQNNTIYQRDASSGAWTTKVNLPVNVGNSNGIGCAALTNGKVLIGDGGGLNLHLLDPTANTISTLTAATTGLTNYPAKMARVDVGGSNIETHLMYGVGSSSFKFDETTNTCSKVSVPVDAGYKYAANRADGAVFAVGSGGSIGFYPSAIIAQKD